MISLRVHRITIFFRRILLVLKDRMEADLLPLCKSIEYGQEVF
ncbi:hypothetical protein HMPREF0666_03208 [Prevotella sp. C561]|nr:hypothetical protein HMPREF0666_03208 [Prevotella sp. C561]